MATVVSAPPTEVRETADAGSERSLATPTPIADVDRSWIEGRWEGETILPGVSIAFAVAFEVGEGLAGSMDIAEQSAFGLELSRLEGDAGRVHFELETATGQAVWEGVLDGDSVEGEFSQAGVVGSFTMRRVGELAAGQSDDNEGATYRQEEVAFASGEVPLAGTLTIPEGDGPHPAVMLINGSGAQDRDANFYGFKSFAIIADHLTRNGVAVLRVDDRGVGGSGGSVPQTTLQERAEDVSAALDVLHSRDDVDPARIGLVGHSEGGMIAPMVAGQPGDVAFLVLMAAPAVSGEALLAEQVGRVLEVEGTAAEDIEKAKRQQALVLRAVATDEGWEEAEATIRKAARERVETLPAVWREAITDIDQYLDEVVSQQIAAVQSPWYRSVVSFDPGPVLKELTVPVLALYGGLDTQVPPETNAAALAHALAESGNSDYTVTVLERANHLFQEAVSGHPNEYPALKKEFREGFLDVMTEWILQRTGAGLPQANKP